MDYVDLGKKIKLARTKKGYSQAELAEIMGYSIQHISHVENGTVKMSMECMIILANALEVSLDELFEKSLTFCRNNDQSNIDILLEKCNDNEKNVVEIVLSLIKTDIEHYIEKLENDGKAVYTNENSNM